MITGQHIADTAINSGLLGTPYSKLDCQAFVEEVLKLAGLKIINYRGSNHMWRDLVYDREPITDYDVAAGTLVFKVKFDGGEKKRGYNDKMGNAVHVGISLGNGKVMHSTTGGVQYGKTNSFTDWGKIKDVDYENRGDKSEEGIEGTRSSREKLLGLVEACKDNLKELEAVINDLYRGT